MTYPFHNLLLVAVFSGFGDADGFSAEIAETNAAVVYERAFKLVEEGFSWQQRQWLTDPEAQSDSTAQDWFRRVDESVSLLHQAAAMPFCEWAHLNDSNHLETVNGALLLSRVVTWRYEGRPPEPATVVRDQLAVLALSRQMGRDWVDRMVALALDGTAVRALGQHLHRMSVDQLKSLRSTLQSVPPREDLGGILEEIWDPPLLEMKREQIIKELMALLVDIEGMFPPDDTASFAHELRLASIVMAEGSLFQIGLEENDSGAGFLLRPGQRKRGVKLVSVNFDRAEALLMKGEQRALVRLNSKEIVPLWLSMAQESLAQVFGEEVALRIRSEEDVEAEVYAMYESSQEELRRMTTNIDFTYANVPAREGEEIFPFFTTNPITELRLKPFRDLYRQAALADTRILMLDAAIDVQLRGEEAMAHHPDPFDDGPFAYEKTEQGFILRSNIENNGEKWALRIGPPDKEEGGGANAPGN